jgi:asparagine synthase (glutamine-hydrolysing)
MLAAQQMYANSSGSISCATGIAIGAKLFNAGALSGACVPVVADEQGSRTLAADIRLDNRSDIGRALGLSAAETAACSDPALLFRALSAWEEGAITRLRGDFAFALWDRERQRLLLARDFLGQKPLHFHSGNGFFAFASMPKGLHGLQEVDRTVDLRGLANFLALLPEDDQTTFFEGVSKVPPGHFMIVTPEGIRSERYWQPPLRLLRLKKREDYVEALRSCFDAAVAARLRDTDREVAAHLSGGLDSGSVAATAAGIIGSKGGKVLAFTSAPREDFRACTSAETIFDECQLAGATAAFHPNIEHVLVRAGSASPLANLDRVVSLYDRPILSLVNLVWLEAIYEAAQRRGIRVLLSGARGNVGFSYSGMTLLPALLRQGRILHLAQEGYALHRNGMRLGSIAAQTLGPFLPKPFWNLLQRARNRHGDVSQYTALRLGAVQRFNLAARAEEFERELGSRPAANSLAARLWILKGVDYGNYNKGVLAGWGIEHRDPTADQDLIELCLSIPDEHYLVDGVTRHLAREAMSERLPEAVLHETRKGYQAADWHEGLSGAREALGEEVGAIAASRSANTIIDCERLQRLLDDWPSNRWGDPQVVQDYRLVLLRAVAAGSFARRIEGAKITGASGDCSTPA